MNPLTLENPMSEDAPTLRVPTIGRTVGYVLTEQDAANINRRRAQLKEHAHIHGGIQPDGCQRHVGNTGNAGQVYPMTIVRVWGDGPDALVNGQVLLDGNDTLWVTSVGVGTDEGTWHWLV